MGRSDTEPMSTTPRFASEDTTKEDLAPTDPSSAAHASDATDPSSASPGNVPSGGDALLEGLRRQRPPPKLTPRVMPASEGGVAVAYYAGPQAAPARFDTPPPEPALEIASTPITELPAVAASAGRTSPSANQETVRRPRPSLVRRRALIGMSAAGVAAVGLLLWFTGTSARGGDDRATPSRSGSGSGSGSAMFSPPAVEAPLATPVATPSARPAAAATSASGRALAPDLRAPDVRASDVRRANGGVSATSTSNVASSAPPPPAVTIAPAASAVVPRAPHPPASGSFEEPVRSF